jgi:non-specific serine/threonine protein kinase
LAVVIGEASEESFARLDRELESLRAELDRAEDADPRGGLELAASALPYWVARGMIDEARARVTRLLARAPAARDATRAKALYAAGTLAFLQGDEPEARALHTESLAIARLLGDDALEADALLGLARVSILAREPVAMEDHARASLAAAEAAHDEKRAATALHHVAEGLRRQKRYAEAVPLYEGAICRHNELGDRRSVALELHNLAAVARRTGDTRTAEERERESISIAGQIRHERLVGYCMLGLAELEVGRGSFASAARLVGASDARFAAVGAARDPEYEDLRERIVREAEAALGGDAFRRELDAGAALTLADAVELTN